MAVFCSWTRVSMANILSLGAENRLSIKLLDPYLCSWVVTTKGFHRQDLMPCSGQCVLSCSWRTFQLHSLCRAHSGKHLTGQKICPTWTSILRMTQKGPLQSSSSVPEAGARCLAFLNTIKFILLYNFLKYLEMFKTKQGLSRSITKLVCSVASWMHQPFWITIWTL